MIGDRLYTDIALGSAAGITTVLVLSGETRLEDLAESPHQPTYTFSNIGEVSDWLTNHIPRPAQQVNSRQSTI
jgi:4-nitrophenyl phosphatase/NagD protein